MAIYVTSDLHGYPFERFQKLLGSTGFGFDDTLYILGDVVDRGDDGVKYLCWLLVQNNVKLILGNHEDMLLRCSFAFEHIINNTLHLVDHEHREMISHWYMNGCAPTLTGFAKLLATNRDMVDDILEYLIGAPLYAQIKVGEREFFLTHGGLGDYEQGTEPSECSRMDLLWSRPNLNTSYHDTITTILGHTPTEYYGPEHKGKMLVTDTWIDIDTSAAYGGHPMLLRLDDMTPFYMTEEILAG
ncbi:MAG: calcineurin [Ruminococcaceae bacterium]|nr:calcineurin [Oscillospiraceae bacterium]